MKFDFSAIGSFFGRNGENNTQSIQIKGDKNQVNQVINNVYVGDSDSELRREVIALVPQSAPNPAKPVVGSEEDGDEDSEEIKRILEYRNLANDGDSETSLLLLEKLKLDDRYSSGYLAFRLYFNIGLVLQNLGEIDEASAHLRAAYDYFPEDNRAQTGLALAEFLDGNSQQALEISTKVATIQGTHRSLAICVAIHAATELEAVAISEDFLGEIASDASVAAAHLRHTFRCLPENYSEALDTAIANFPEDDAIAEMWALHVLDDMKQNQAFLLGAKTSDGFEENATRSAEILRKQLENNLAQRPPNLNLLPSQAGNAAVALRLVGKFSQAAGLIEKVLEKQPDLAQELAQIRVVLLLQEDRYNEAIDLIAPYDDDLELQVMASELEAETGAYVDALARIHSVLNSAPSSDLQKRALVAKAKIGIASQNQGVTDEALEELEADFSEEPELVLLRSTYNRAFVLHTESEISNQIPEEEKDRSSEEKQLLSALKKVENLDFFTLLETAEELNARGYYRECTDILYDRVSFSKESPALATLCKSCLNGNFGALAKQIQEKFTPSVKESVFGWKFRANVAILNGEIVKAIPLTRKLFEKNPNSINSLERYVQTLLRANDKTRVQRIVRELDDGNLAGTVEDRRNYVNLLVFCGEVERARKYAYRLFCENLNDHHSWMALSSSVLAFGSGPTGPDGLDMSSVQEDCTFLVEKPNGERQSYTIEGDQTLMALREGNIPLNHPIAEAAIGKLIDEEFDWPIKTPGLAKVLGVKHKTLAAFHHVTERFEEIFPDTKGFKSVSFSLDAEGGLDEMKAMLKQRADYSQSKAKEYQQGSYPIAILGFHLGLDPIDAMLGLKVECGIAPKVSSCSTEDQEKASVALQKAKKKGVIVDAAACYLMRRLRIEDQVKDEFGKIGVTQHTIDIFSDRLREAENSSYIDSETGKRVARSISVREGQIVVSETAEDEVAEKVELMRSDLEWLKSDCEMLPAVAKTDPDDAIIRLRMEEGGRFFDDIFAADGSGRVLISEDLYLRQWADGLFKIKGAWLQALLFHLEAAEKLPIAAVTTATVELCHLGEHALSTNAIRLQDAAEMYAAEQISEQDFALFCSLIGQSGAEMQSHIAVTATAINRLWNGNLAAMPKQKATSIILRNLLRHQSEETQMIVQLVSSFTKNVYLKSYIDGWYTGHFLSFNNKTQKG